MRRGWDFFFPYHPVFPPTPAPVSFRDLSGNPFFCDCNLAWLPHWVEERNVTVSRPSETQCAQPLELMAGVDWLPDLAALFLLLLLPGADYVACLPDNSTGGAESVVRFTSRLPQNLTEEMCSALCYADGQDYGGFSEEADCFCGFALEPNVSSGCLPFCARPLAGPLCGGPTLLSRVFPAVLPVSLEGPRTPCNAYQEVAFILHLPVAVGTIQWDFGDETGLFNTTKTTILQVYTLPGLFNVTATVFVSNRFISAQTKIEVQASPEEMALQCPSLVKTNESLQLHIRNRGGTGLSVAYNITVQDQEPGRVVIPGCPSDSVVFPGNRHCYWLGAEKAEWLEAQRLCQEHGSGSLAFVSSPEIQNFLVSSVTRSLDVWIGFNDVASPSPLPQGEEGFDVQSCQNWLPGEPHPSNADHCVRMSPAGQCNTDLCTAKHSYVCEHKPQGGFYSGVLGHHWAAQRLVSKELTCLSLHSGRSSYKNQCVICSSFPSGCNEVTNVTDLFLVSQENENWTPMDCPVGFQWCHSANSCQPLGSCCHQEPCANSTTQAAAGVPPPCQNKSWSLELKTSHFMLPLGPSMRYLVSGDKDTFVQPNDTVILQHDAGPGTLLLCHPSQKPLTQMGYFTLSSLGWDPVWPAQPAPQAWRNNSRCPLRVLAAAEETVPLLPKNHSSVHRPGLYAVQATVSNGVFRRNFSCSFWALSAISSLRVIYPPEKGGKVYVESNSTWLVVKILSGMNATSGRLGGNQSFPFGRSCPPAVTPWVAECARESNDTWFSVVLLEGIGHNLSTVVLWAKNAVSSQNITVRVKAEDAIRGLRVTPDPETRVLQNKRSYVPVMDAGSDVTFRWRLDDKSSFTFYNDVFHVLYQSPAVYKLSLTASNNVSNITVCYNITVEEMNRMKDLKVSEILTPVPQNSSVELSATVTVDSAVDAKFLWDFGDGDQAVLEFHPPYNESFLKPDPKIHQVQIGHNLSHIYQDPGEYSLTVVVSNEFENLTYSTPVHIYAHLTEVAMRVASDVLVVGHPVTFEAQAMPSGFGVSYTWNFGDGSEAFVESQAAVVHTYSSRGMYKVWVQANNTISTVETCQHYRVFEEISGLWVSLNETIELLTPIEISASVETGDNITWIFDMGDGTIVETPVASVKHTYLKDMNYTVNVTAANPVNSLSRAVPIQIFVLMVLKIEPSSCIREDPEVQLTAHVSGNPQNYFFDWTFGDGSSNITVYGDPTVIHNFTFSGIFRLSLVLSSKVNKAQYYTEICVEPEITNVTLSVRPELVWLGNETKFQVTALPPFRYHYLWDFGTNNSTRSGGTEVSYTYRNPGDYMVMVTVCNNVSFNNVSASVEVQEPVGVAKIESNGSKVLELNQVYLFWANVTGTKVSYLWYFGDGTSQLGKFITHSYNKSGTHTISLTCWNDVSFHEAKMNVTVKRRLQGLSINASRTVVPLNGSVSFMASLLAGTAIRYSWILCDRCTPIPGLSTISYTFRSVGTFNVIVTAENEIGGLQSNIFIYVLEQIEGLQITGGDFLDDLYFPTNKTLQLQATVKDGTNISYNWTVLKESHPVQTFTGQVFSFVILEAGPLDVHLKATNMLGSSAVNKTVEFIEEVGALKPTATPNPAAVNASVNISAGAAAGSGLLYTWHFEGGLSLCTASSTIAHSFLSPGAQIVAVAAGNKFGSANASLVVCVQEPIVGPEIRIVRPNSSSVESGTVVNFAGELERGSDVLWTWKMQDKTISGQRVALNFPVAGIFPVCLNASNNVSWDVACLNLTVQDAIQGLKLSVSEDVLQPGEMVSFEVEISSGSSVSYWITIGSNHSEILSASNFTYKFSQVGEYLVRVTAENQVSVAYAEHLIVVLEAVRGLQITDCCERGIPAVVEKQFTARIEKGSQVSYVWHFTLVNEQQRSQVHLEGQSVSYTPEAAGQLDIHLCAFNSLSSLNITVVIQVQDFILQLSIQPVDSFVNRTTLFKASVLPSAREVLFWWHFGDGSPAVQTSVPSVSHVYLRPGDYVVEVNATNLISFSIAHRTVTVRILECEEPEAELALPAQVYMKRSQKNYLEAQIDLRGCTRYQTAYLWEIYKTPSCLHLEAFAKVLLVSVDVNRPQLVIPKLTLDLGNYCFKFLVSFGDTPLSKSIFANVTVLPNKLVPIIDGGSYRVWSSTRDLILDGEKSYDPNWEDWEQTPLHYHWTCVSSSKNSPGAHGLNFSATGGLVTIPRAMLEADVEYTFDLTVSKPGMDSEATNQTVLLKKGTVPIVSLECVSCKAQSVYEVSRSSYVYLEGTCLNCQNDGNQGVRWTAQSFKNKSLLLDEKVTSTGDAEMSLVLRPWALEDGEGYTFTLYITDEATGEEGYASIDLFPNQPPFGGSCQLSPASPVQALATKIHYECAGWRDSVGEDPPLVYILMATRCRPGQCDEFLVYKGSHPAHAAFLPPGFREHGSLVFVSVFVQDQLGATVEALNRSMVITLPRVPEGFPSLPQWLYNKTEVMLQGLVKQSDPQPVIEYSLALITILNELGAEPDAPLQIWIRKNVTKTLTSLNVNTVDDIRQIVAALAQCMVASKEFVCRSCLTKTLRKLETMMTILQGETLQGTMTPKAIADNILDIMGDLIHLVNAVSQESERQELYSAPNREQVASKAYTLSTDLMRILMKSRVLNEEPLELARSNITARGKRANPRALLCYRDTQKCQFSIPQAFRATFSDLADVIQVIFHVDYNPFPFGYITNHSVSSEVASMEFQTSNGTEIAVGSLDLEKAITVAVVDSGPKNITVGTVVVEEKNSVHVVVSMENSNTEAGLYFQITFNRYVSREKEPFLAVCLFHSPERNCTASKEISLEDMKEGPQGDPRLGPLGDHHLNITNHFVWSPVEVTLGLYSSLCQYFNTEEARWKTEGMAPLEGATPEKALCLTQHLTAFGASLFVPSHSVQFIKPPPGPGLNYIVLLTCVVCLVTYSMAAVIVHKLDLIDISRVGSIPFCGKNGLYRYEILVKTGWGKGSGTTAHVGITLYGMDSKSGHRHLDDENAFRRNSLDIFQVATERNLGSVWKIRIWHDNKGLSPAWFLQHVIVRDLQTYKSYHFLVNDWLSVDSLENDGLVEKEVFAASEADLRSCFRIFIGELQRGFFERHIWLSLWDRPPRSRFTRVQRASCCCLLIFLFLCANAVWYGVVADANFSPVPISTLIPINGETVLVGLVSSLVVYPLYLVLLFLFRMARSKVNISQSLAHSDQQSLEIDNYLDSSLLESSFITFPGLRTEVRSIRASSFLSISLIRWQSNEALLNWPDLLSDPSIMGLFLAGLHLASHLVSQEEPGLRAERVHPKSLSFFLPIFEGVPALDYSGRSNVPGDKMEAIVLQRLNEKGQSVAVPGRELNHSAKSTRTGNLVLKRLLPSWCSYLAHAISLLLLLLCFGVSVWIGVGFSSSVALMWLISGIFSFLSSFLLWEPLKILLEAVYFSLVAKRLHPEEDDTLVEHPIVEHISEKIGKVRPPQGFALFQAKEEARKVKLLHSLLKNCFVYMFFLLVILLTNYSGPSHNSQAFLLQKSIKQQLGTTQFLDIKRAWYWGYLSIYDSGGYIQELGTTLQESSACLQGLQQNNWISNRSQAVFVEMTQYHPVLDLHAAVTLRLEFPVAKHAVPAVTVTPFPLHPLGGLSIRSSPVPFLLPTQVFLMILVVYFVVSESLAIKKEGKAYFALLSSYGQWLLILASTCTVVVHLSQATLAERQWAKYLKNKRAFTSFYPVASLHVAFSCLAASLLFLLTVKASQQLRFIRQWSTFGKALQKSSRELLGTGLAFAILALAYTQLCLGLFMWGYSSAPMPCAFHHHYDSHHFAVGEAQIGGYLGAPLSLQGCRMLLFPQFRHKVHFEGMEPLPSRSSSQDSRSLQGATPSAASESSRASTSSSQLDGLSLATSTCDSTELDVEIQQLLSLLQTLLTQFDRVNGAAEEVYGLECQLESSRNRQRPATAKRKRPLQANNRVHPSGK
uniref:Polycystin 1, transient receptor potential channel interacting n=1 Tax=Pseudonaja textilis TaxID=8673 RepID=A0A670YAW2_PSETE